jgi:hypothetical protein
MRGLDHRVAALEQRTMPDRLDVIVVSFVRPGIAGPIEDVPTGYTAGWGDDLRRWDRQPGETLDELLDRAKRNAARRPGCIPCLLTQYD